MNKKLMMTALKNISRNKRRSILSAVAIAVAAMSIVMLFAMIAGMSNDMEYNLKNYYTGNIQIQHRDFEEYERYNPVHLTVDWDAIAPVLGSIDGVEAYTPRINFPVSIYIDEETHGALGVGVDLEQEAAYNKDIEAIVYDGRLPAAGQNEIIMGGLLANNLGLAIGDRVTLLSTTAARGTNAITVELVGIASYPVTNMNASTFWMPLGRAQYFLKMDGGVSNILIKTAEDAKEKDLIPVIGEALMQTTGTEFDIQAWTDLNVMYGFLKIAQYIYYFMGVFFFLLGSTVIINTTMMVIFERMREIGTLAALGMHGKELVRLFLLEGMFISTIGSFFGVTLGVVFTNILSRVGIDFTDALSGMDFEMSSILYPEVNVPITIIVFFYAIAIASLATLIPSKKASRIEPVEALRYI